MDWVTGIQRAVDYVEAHLLEPISFEEAAKQAYSSSFRFWAQCMQDGTIDALCRYIPEQDLFGGIVGISFGEDCQDPDYPYAIAAQYNGEPVAEADLQVQNIPAHTYVVFPCKGKMPQALQTLYQKICSEFFPNSEYQPGNGPDFEVYPSADVDSPDFSCEIWVAAEKK